MKGFFDGIGQWAATFGCEGLQAGQVVKPVGEGRVAACGAGDAFCGCVISAGRDGSACSVALGGIVSVPFSGAAPGTGWQGLSADGEGGVSADPAGHEFCVLDVDAVQNSVTFIL